MARSRLAGLKLKVSVHCFLASGILLFSSGPVLTEVAQGPKVRDGDADAHGIIPLTAQEKKKVDDAIERGVEYLRRTQFADGSWKDAKIARNDPVGFTALPALALLEIGVSPKDEAIQRAARFIRFRVTGATQTYGISLAILFLDRLGNKEDQPLVQSLFLRLAAGQTGHGGWSYNCPILGAADEKNFLEVLRKRQAAISKLTLDRGSLPPSATRPNKPTSTTLATKGEGDNSNTQFAILALSVARRYDLPFLSTIARMEQRFRSTQELRGWGYRCYNRPHNASSGGSMTCVGLLALAIGRSWQPQSTGEESKGEKPTDPGIALGLSALSSRNAVLVNGKMVDFYYLWSVERVAVLCGLNTIGGSDWYRGGLGYILPTQMKDGCWYGANCGDSRVISTSMALLFLKRSDLFPDLRETLQKRVKITDPGLDKAISPKKSPGEKTDPKRGGDKTSPGEKNDFKKAIDKKGPDEKSSASLLAVGHQPEEEPRRKVGLQERNREKTVLAKNQAARFHLCPMEPGVLTTKSMGRP